MNYSINLQRVLLGVVTSLALAASMYAQTGNTSRQLTQASAQTPPSRRLALVIGNGAYTNAPPLKNPPHDARDMAATLKELGFEVATGIDVNQREMKRLIREFGQKLKAGGSGLFYYAGHGVQSKGRNYLIPVDADIQSEAEAEDAGVDVSLVLNYMDDAQNGLNIVILDACRNNPFSRSFRSASGGLAQVDAPTGTLIAYATAPGRVASDGPGNNGLYTSELLKQMRVPGLSVTDMFMRVRAEVMKQTGSKQVPWESSSLVGSFYFNASAAKIAAGNNNGVTAPAENGNLSKVDPAAIELSYWETIKNSTNADDFKSYLKKYPNGQFAELANNRVKALEGTSRVSPSADTKASKDETPRENDTPSLADTMDWLKEKFASGSIKTGTVEKTNNRLIVGDGCTIKIDTYHAFIANALVYEYTVPLADMKPSYTAYPGGEQPRFRTTLSLDANGRKIYTVDGKGVKRGDNDNSIFFDVTDQDTADRIGKAFVHAIKLCKQKQIF